ncbi:glycosyltransferase [Neptuniibacter halophilus]|uniref:glycosyltransferase n=1 Tax=Neptuniibacter halophilus TaxID=651666 RepID=UPI0025744731|nr:hypothetical protein [Neptuniibacter halophilus]
MLLQQSRDFTLHVVGQQFRHTPPPFSELHSLLGDQAGHWGYMQSREAYQKLLQQADVVLSTALHDYQGIAVLEGAAAGAWPIVPDRLAYQELFPEACRYPAQDEPAAMAAMLLQRINEKAEGGAESRVDVSQLGWGQLAECYRQQIERVAKRGAP